MKNLFYILKKFRLTVMAIWATIIMLTMVGKVQAQTYAKYYMDSLTNFQTIYPCKSTADTLIFYKPVAFTSGVLHWNCMIPPYDYCADSLLIPNDYNSYGGATVLGCYSGNNLPNKAIYVIFISSPILVLTDTTLCGIFNYVLDPGNDTGCTFVWNTGVTTQLISATQPGIYWTDITNTCGTIRDSVVISSNNPNPPILSDTTFCLEGSALLNPGTYATYSWNTGALTATISATTSGIYAVTVSDNGCTDTTSAVVTVLQPYQGQEICYVGFDTVVYQNRINWRQHFGVAIDSIQIIKETAQDVWSEIATVPNTDSSFVDPDSQPQSNSDSYRILIKDSCGNLSDTSAYHRTMTLVVSSFSDTGVINIGFTWNSYEGVNVGLYTLYGIEPSGQITAVATNLVPAPSGQMNLYNWSSPTNPYVKFFVAFPWSCAKSVNLVRSNYLQLTTSIVDELSADQITVYPTLTSGQINITTNIPLKEVKVYNALGQVILISKEKHFTIPNKGLYYLDIQTNQGSLLQKVVVQ